MEVDPSQIRLAPDLSFADIHGGRRVSFTRSEKRALELLTQHPDRVFTRDQILDAVTGSGSDSSDRNIDFLINRLRRKLADNARDPRFIATRYGEGYVWIGNLWDNANRYADAYLVIGPFKGMENLGDSNMVAEGFASHLHAALRLELPPEKKVALAPDCPDSSEFSDDMPSLSVELTFFEESGTVNCVATAREFRSRRILTIHRVRLEPGEPLAPGPIAADTARLLLAEMWRTQATQTQDGVPLPVLMHQASTHPPEHGRGTLADSDEQLAELVSRHEKRIVKAWKENEVRLTHLLRDKPEDATLKVMYATHIHSKYIQFGYALFQNGIDTRAHDEDTIERLVLEALPHIQSQPEYVIMAAKLLHFLERGYFELARELSEQAYASSISAAGSLAIIGQFRSFAGETEAALRCLDQALNLVKPRSSEHFYTLTIKLQALHSIADFDRLHEAKREIYRMSAALMLLYEPLFSHPEKLSLRARAVMLALSRRKAVGFLTWQNYVAARLFRDPGQAANAILTLLTLVVRRFGKAAVPDEIWVKHPQLASRFA